MDLIAAMAALTTRVEAIKRNAAGDQLARGFQTRAHELEPVAEAYAKLAKKTSTLRKNRIAVTLPDKVPGLAHAATKALEAFEQDNTSVIEIPSDLRRTFWDQAGDVSVRIDTALQVAWREHVQAAMPRVDRLLFEALPTVTSAHRQELAAITTAAMQLASAVPEDDEGVANLGLLVDRMNRLIVAVDIDGLPVEVRSFIRAIAQGTATLDLVTPAVASWLKAQGLTSKVRLQFGSTSQ